MGDTIFKLFKDKETRKPAIYLTLVGLVLVFILCIIGVNIKFGWFEFNPKSIYEKSEIEEYPEKVPNPYFEGTNRSDITVRLVIQNKGTRPLMNIRDSLVVIQRADYGSILTPVYPSFSPSFNDLTILKPKEPLDFYHKHINLNSAPFTFLCYKINYEDENGVPGVFKRIFLVSESGVNLVGKKDYDSIVQILRVGKFLSF